METTRARVRTIRRWALNSDDFFHLPSHDFWRDAACRHVEFLLLGLLFVAENMSNVLESSDEFGSQVLHLAGHIRISYFIHDLNRRHIFNTKDKLT